MVALYSSTLRARYETWTEEEQRRFRNVVGMLGLNLKARAQWNAFKYVLWQGLTHADAAALLGTKPSLVEIARWRVEKYFDAHCAWWRTTGLRPAPLPGEGAERYLWGDEAVRGTEGQEQSRYRLAG